jgi:hypothetical protein
LAFGQALLFQFMEVCHALYSFSRFAIGVKD